MNSIKKIFIIIFTALFFFSCTTNKRISRSDITFEELLENSRANFERIESYSGSGTIELNLNNLKMNLQFSISTKKQDQALVDLFGPLGIDIGSIFINDDTILVFNAFKDQLILTRFSSERFKKLSPVEVDKNFFYSILFFFIDQNSIKADSSFVMNNEKEFILIKYLNEKKFEFIYDKFFRSLIRIVVFDNFNEPTFEINLLKFKNNDEINFPELITFTNLKTNESISLNFKKIEFNKIVEDLNFELPENVEIIKW